MDYYWPIANLCALSQCKGGGQIKYNRESLRFGNFASHMLFSGFENVKLDLVQGKTFICSIFPNSPTFTGLLRQSSISTGSNIKIPFSE